MNAQNVIKSKQIHNISRGGLAEAKGSGTKGSGTRGLGLRDLGLWGLGLRGLGLRGLGLRVQDKEAWD